MTQLSDLTLWEMEGTHGPISEDERFLREQLITYIGNKRALLPQIGAAVAKVKHRPGRTQLRVFDVFSGAGVVSRFFTAHACYLASNDFEDYAAVTARCCLRNGSTIGLSAFIRTVADPNRGFTDDGFPGFIEVIYTPRDETRVTKEDGFFCACNTARRQDSYRRLIESVPEPTFLRLCATKG